MYTRKVLFFEKYFSNLLLGHTETAYHTILLQDQAYLYHESC